MLHTTEVTMHKLLIEEWRKTAEIKGHYAKKNIIQDTSQSNHV